MIPASSYPALKGRKVLQLLERLGYVVVRQRGSHKQLRHEQYGPVLFATHDGKEMRPAHLKKLLEDQCGLPDNVIKEVLGLD